MSDNLPTTRNVWKDQSIQGRFLELISAGYKEAEAVDILNESNAAQGSDVRVSLQQYLYAKKRDHDFHRAVIARMEARVAKLDRNALALAVESEDFRTQLQYLEFNERRIARMEKQVQRQEEHEDVMHVALERQPSEFELSERAAKARRGIIDVETVDDDAGDDDGSIALS